MQRYEKYKDSGVDWIDEIPDGWKMLSNKYIFKLKKNLVGKKSSEYELLSLTLKGIIKRNMETPEGKFPAEFDTYQEVRKNDFVFCLFDVEETPRTVGLSTFDGMITGAYTVFSVSENFDRNYLYYFYLNLDVKKRLKFLYKGLRNTIPKDSFSTFKTIVPPFYEQQTIAEFLDDKTAKIDQLIAIKEKEINLLKERRQTLIQKAVTKGLDPNVKLKDSGVNWIGEIPEHWEVRKLKQVSRINLKSLPENHNADFEFRYVDIGNVSYEDGICGTETCLFKNSPSRARRMAKTGDTIVSTVRTYLKAIDFINQDKSTFIYSTGFAVLQPNLDMYPKFLYSFVKSNAFTGQVSANSKGMSYPAINSSELGNQKVLYLPVIEQKQIVEFISDQDLKISKAISLKQQETEKLKEYKIILIDNVVTGKVKVS